MNWNNLKKNKCPDCYSNLLVAKNGNRKYCENKRCDFQITNNKFNKITKAKAR